MKKLVAAIALCCVIGFAAWKYAQPTTFTVKLKDNRTLKITEIAYTPKDGIDSIEGLEEFSVHNDVGHFHVPKNLKDIKSIEVTDDEGLNLKVTFLSGYVAQGNRRVLKEDVISDFIEGNCGKIEVFLPLRKIVSITQD
jgi:hypothetical protein